jgi:hypothetical protein
MVVLGLCAVATLCITQRALAQDQVADVVDGLKQSPVYIVAGTEGTDGNTAANLVGQMNDDDNIILVMLPASASSFDGGSLGFAKVLSSHVGPKKIIGLTVGDEAVAYAPQMPEGVPADLMNRAASVSTNNVETLGTFVRNVHLWQSEHPEAKTTGPSQSEDKGNNLLGIILMLLGGALLACGVALRAQQRSRQSGEARKHFKAPDKVADQLERIAHLREQVHDPEFQSALFNICNDLERYFLRYSSNKSRDTVTFAEHLKGVISVLEKYIEVQDHPRYYNDPSATLERGKKSVCDFGDFVITSIRNGNDADLLNYKVDTKILGAKKYSV